MSGFAYTKQPVKAKITRHIGTRIIDTIYQNLTGRPLLCIVTVRCRRNLDNEYALALANISTLTPPTDDVGGVGCYRDGGVETYDVIEDVLVFAVPNEWYYRVVTAVAGTGTVTLIYWIEVEL